jgi:hypothetical protein
MYLNWVALRYDLPGTIVVILKIFLPKNLIKNVAFSTASFCKKNYKMFLRKMPS